MIGSLSLSACGKEENGIEFPLVSEIISIEIDNDEETIVCTDKEKINLFVEKVYEATDTEKESLDDIPTALEYVRVDILHSGGGISSVFVYQEEDQWYIEQPYQGIYQTDETLLGLL